jgi:predicted nucleic acid-binding protein
VNEVLVDTGFIVARLDRSEQHHEQCLRVTDSLQSSLITCEAVIVESCYLLRHLGGAADVILQKWKRASSKFHFHSRSKLRRSHA